MPTIGYHASHEQHRPSDLLGHAQQAEAAGFAAVSSSDHFSPWNHEQGESGFSWSWLGAAMQATSVPFGLVCAPGQRYHPAVVAQAVATLAELFPGRFSVALGTGEASNEHITGERWPDKAARSDRLLECVHVIRSLLAGDEVSVDGHVRVDRARLWTRPGELPPLFGAALTPETAAWCGGWADGLVTVAGPPPALRSLIDAFRTAGGAEKPIVVQAKVAYAETEEDALAGAFEQWRTNVFDSTLMADLELVEQFEAAARYVRPDDVRHAVFVSSEPSAHAEHLHRVLECGVDALFVHQVPRPQAAFIDVYGTKVLPELAR